MRENLSFCFTSLPMRTKRGRVPSLSPAEPHPVEIAVGIPRAEGTHFRGSEHHNSQLPEGRRAGMRETQQRPVCQSDANSRCVWEETDVNRATPWPAPPRLAARKGAPCLSTEERLPAQAASVSGELLLATLVLARRADSSL